MVHLKKKSKKSLEKRVNKFMRLWVSVKEDYKWDAVRRLYNSGAKYCDEAFSKAMDYLEKEKLMVNYSSKSSTGKKFGFYIMYDIFSPDFHPKNSKGEVLLFTTPEYADRYLKYIYPHDSSQIRVKEVDNTETLSV